MLARPERAPTVWVDGARMGEALRGVVHEASRRAGLRPVSEPRDQGDAAPELLVSTLAPGERRIPEDAVVALTRDAHLRLLLLCTDELVRPTVTLHGGRVVLLGPPLDERRVAARLRSQLADRRASEAPASVSGEGPAHVCLREDATAQAYFGLAAASEGDESPELMLPQVHRVSGGLAFTLHQDAALDADRGARLAEALARDEANEEKERRLLELVGAEAAVVHLSASRDWLVHWPNPAAGLFLASPMRLPPAWRLNPGLSSSVVHQPAASGDVLVATWGAGWGSALGGPPREVLAELAEAARAGGPRVLDVLAERLKAKATASASALIVEVR